jgi:hypothetical protein
MLAFTSAKSMFVRKVGHCTHGGTFASTTQPMSIKYCGAICPALAYEAACGALEDAATVITLLLKEARFVCHFLGKKSRINNYFVV